MDRFYRVYCEENLGLRRKRPWHHVSAVHRLVKQPAGRPNEVWGMDFVADQLADGRKLRTLTIIDLFTRECLVRIPASRDRRFRIGVTSVSDFA